MRRYHKDNELPPDLEFYEDANLLVYRPFTERGIGQQSDWPYRRPRSEAKGHPADCDGDRLFSILTH